MNELRQKDTGNAEPSEREKLLPVQVSPTEVCYMTPQQLVDSITDEDIQLGLDSAGIWSDIGMTEDEVLARLNEIRYGSEPSPVISPE